MLPPHLLVVFTILHLAPRCTAQQPIQQTSSTSTSWTEWKPTIALTSTPTSSFTNTSTTTDAPNNMRSYETTNFSPTYPATLRFPSGQDTIVAASLSSLGPVWSAAPFYPPLQTFLLAYTPSTLSQAYANPTVSWDWDAIVRAPWYTAVPPSLQTLVTEQEQALQSAFDAITGNDAPVDRDYSLGIVLLVMVVGFMGGVGVVL